MCPSCPRKNGSYFVLLPFLEQLQEMYKRKEFYNSLQNRFHRLQYPPGIITDVYDCSLYRTWYDNEFFQILIIYLVPGMLIVQQSLNQQKLATHLFI